VPWYVKVLAAAIAAYALSPIDLIPDFIPVLGYVDELILLPLAIAGAIHLIDPALFAEHRAKAAAITERPVSKWAAMAIVVLWVAALAFGACWLWR
jgi:uncharacterized membrane protein YkvA (DUF1232 family)